jgi:penicillin-binding protein 2
VDNRPSFDLYLIPFYIEKHQESLDELSHLLHLNRAEIEKHLTDINEQVESAAGELAGRARTRLIKQKKQASYKIMSNISLEDALEIESHPEHFQGIWVKEKLSRHYRFGELACHIIGYLGLIKPEEYEKLKSNYGFRKMLNPAIDDDTYAILEAKGEFLDDQVGRFGAEKVYNERLTGLAGVQMVEYDFATRTAHELGRVGSTSGTDIILTIDLSLQQKIEALLANKVGSVIVMDVSNGEILAMASSPGFNPNSLQSPVSTTTVQYLFNSPLKPLYNRAIAGEYALGSIFKLVTATAALENQRITEHTTFDCNGYFSPKMKHFKCWTAEYGRGHGTMNIVSGLQHSCNVFFFNTGKVTGADLIIKTAQQYGFGEFSGFDLGVESKGLLPIPEWRRQRYQGQKWTLADTLNLAIGQGDLMVTPLQVVRCVAAIANGGTLVTPHCVYSEPFVYTEPFASAQDKLRECVPQGKLSESVKEEGQVYPVTKLNLNPTTLSLIRQGLYEVVHSDGGTAHHTGLDPFPIAGKTSTAEVSSPTIMRPPHAWFVGFLPYDKPRFAFVVMIENGGKGSEVAAPIAAGFMEELLKIR